VKVDEIALTLPAEDAFHRVVHLVLGGLANRHDLTVETLDDLTLALDTVLERYGDGADEVTVRVGIEGDEVRTELGPFRDGNVAEELAHDSADALDLHRILFAVCDGVSVFERDDAEWVELTKHVERVEGEAA
jgi:hypothetical protein